MFGDEIIKILDALCEKFGMAIDWTTENITPYLENLAGRIISFEISTSIFWITFWGVLTISLWVVSGILLKSMKDKWNNYNFTGREIFTVAFTMIAIVCSIIFVVTACTQCYDIIMCNTIPEAMVLKYIENIMTNIS